MFCPKCGNEIAEGSAFCGKCGAPVGAQAGGSAPVGGAQGAAS
ncbi:zinc-ribbon domain-containing protein, partial [Adlercreutzia sp.]